jgi:hypothetical protein
VVYAKIILVVDDEPDVEVLFRQARTLSNALNREIRHES